MNTRNGGGARTPDYMVPVPVVTLDALPLTSNESESGRPDRVQRSGFSDGRSTTCDQASFVRQFTRR